MQWKIPFIEYLESDRTRVKKVAEEFSALSLPADQSPPSAHRLSEAQLNVIKRFPSPLDSTDRNWNKMEELVNSWKDKSQIWPMAHTCKLMAAVNSVSAVWLTHGFRRAFNLADGKTAFLNSYVPAVALPVLFGSILHYKFITAPIASGYEQCPTCQCINAGLIQAITSTVYPVIYGSVSSIYFADYFRTYATPDSIRDSSSRRYLYDVWLKSVSRNKTAIISVAILNFVFAYYMTLKERDSIEFMYFSLLQRQCQRINK